MIEFRKLNKRGGGDVMNYDYNKLRGKIKEEVGTQGLFAKALGMGVSTLNLKLNNKAEWTQDEMRESLRLLKEPVGMIKDYFFTHEV